MSAWRAELLKITTVRGQWLSALVACVAIPLTSLLVVATGGLATGESTTSGAATGTIVGLLAFGIWSATITAGEYAQGTMVQSLATVPRRGALLAAKLGATGAAAGAGGLLSAAGALLVVFGVRAPGTYGFGNPAALLGIALVVLVVVVIGASIGIMTKSPSASITLVVLVLLLPRAASGLLGGLQPWIVGANPDTVVTEMVGGGQLSASQTFPAGTWAAAMTMVGAAVAFAGVGAVMLARRDG